MLLFCAEVIEGVISEKNGFFLPLLMYIEGSSHSVDIHGRGAVNMDDIVVIGETL